MGKPTILPSLRSAAQKKPPLVKVGQSNVRVAWDSIDVLLGVYVLLVSGTPRCQLSPREISSLAGILPRHARTTAGTKDRCHFRRRCLRQCQSAQHSTAV